ncbi:MAG: GAF domain-containing protein, partial [Chloroflexi bacterium]|nr:GAF domain-containing protein [Chloroflexota bacterium]
HDFFTRFVQTQGYVDAFLIDSSGNVVYSLRKGGSFAARLTADEYADSNLTGLYQQLRNAEAGQTYLADVRLFDDEKALFIGSPIYQGSAFLGILAYQLPLSEINAIVQDRSGLGKTGETYLAGKVGDQNELRSDRVVKAGNYIGDPKPGDDADQALAGVTGETFKVGSTGVYEISVFSPLAIETPGLNWAILTTISVEEMMVPKAEGAELDMIAQFKETYGYYDVFLISPDGYIFYTIEHEPDFQTNILTGPYQDSNLADLVADVLENQQPVEIVDFEPYAPSLDDPAGFFAAPVFYQGDVALIVAAQISLDDINALMGERSGLGESGETYVVGQDNLFRNDSRFLDQLGVETSIMNEAWPIDTVATRSALEGGSGTEVIADYRGVSVLSSWSPLVLRAPDENHPDGIVWAFMAEIDEAEALQPVGVQTRTILTIALLIGVLTVAAGFGVSQLLANPIIRLTGVAQQVSAGDLSVQAEVTTQDEVSILAKTFNTMTAQLRETLEGLEERVAERTRNLELAAEVGRSVSQVRALDVMLRDACELIRKEFDLYYTQVYLTDPSQRNLILEAGTGEVGAQLLARGHRLQLNTGSINGRAAVEKRTVVISDTAESATFRPNALLPDTRGEMAVPLIVGEKVVGVLDMQSSQPGVLNEEVLPAFEALAGQLAVAIQNANLLAETEQARAEVEKQAARLVRTGWNEYMDAIH